MKGTKYLMKKRWKKQKRQYACEQYKNLSGEETEKKHHYGRGRHKDLLEYEYKIFFLKFKKKKRPSEYKTFFRKV